MNEATYVVIVEDGRGRRKNKDKDFPATGAGLKQAWSYAVESKTKRNQVKILELTPNKEKYSMLRHKASLVATIGDLT